jgi:diacylglycerol kinase (ATP)
MTSENNKNKFYVPTNWFSSLRIAIKGLVLIIKNERNFKIQLFTAFIVGLLGLLLKYSHQDWINVGFLVCLVLISEAFNSVVEALSDTISKEYRVNIKYAKDVAAGAVLIASITSAIAGFIIIFPYILRYLRQVNII